MLATVGIIAEFNPLHNGHKKLIDFAKSIGDTVVCAISGNFVQRGDTALFSKQKRAEMALLVGADVVCEMPCLWSMSTAMNFALCGVWQLYSLGVDTIVFGSECGNIDILIKTAEVLMSEDFSNKINEKIKDGITFAAARNIVAKELGVPDNILEKPNNNLGVEYIIASKRMSLNIKFETLKRFGEEHDSLSDAPNFVSSSFIRQKIISGDIAYTERFMPLAVRGIIDDTMVSDIGRMERTILGILRTKTIEDFRNLPDLSEGIENKLLFSIKVATSLDELYNMIKSKRYTLSRIRRLCLAAALGFDKDFFMKKPPYVRVLGVSKEGEKHLKSLPDKENIIIRVSDIKQLGENAGKVFETECIATDLYGLSFKTPTECGLEYKYKFLKTENVK